MNCNAPMPMTEFDMVTLDDSIQMMKAIIPYLSFPMQKSMAVMVRIKELTDTIKCYSQGRVFPDRTGAGQTEMLSALGRCCPPDIQNSINMMNQMMQFSNAMNLYKDMEQSPEFTNIMNMMNEMNSEVPPQPAKTDTDDINNDTNTSAADTAVNSTPDEMLQGMMNDEQMQMYNDYLSEIDNIFEKTENADVYNEIQEPEMED